MISTDLPENSGYLINVIAVILTIALALWYPIYKNSQSEEVWNNGVCSVCEEKYELRMVVRRLHFWNCPECGSEVTRYMGWPYEQHEQR